ncbi:unnamed protein product [Eruca vesicaria subsp. sativa]|uniref:Uncharacterized protein n=1 Tax=Eruca vesicaria subsp. sativa TaxID=29727 RepID=A0ABC8JIT0_ERUVS|nr:unnamed protein product [Eruca vesicaria subsp. sativa]
MHSESYTQRRDGVTLLSLNASRNSSALILDLHVCDVTMLMLLVLYHVEGKTYTFHVKVATYNFTLICQIFTITRILDERDCVPLPNFLDNGRDDEDGGDMPSANPILAKVEGRNGEATLIADNVSSKVADPALQIVKKVCKF